MNKYVVSAAIVNPKSKKILLAKRSKDTTYPGLWCTPGGTVEDDEFQLQALAREAREELLIALKIDGVKEEVYRHDIRSTRSGKMTTIVCYHVPIDAIEGIPAPGDKTEEVRWFSADELSGLAMTPADEANYSALLHLVS
jgi:8-oxo-dGTP pyrophosphatase MutT (NUDIX family)